MPSCKTFVESWVCRWLKVQAESQNIIVHIPRDLGFLDLKRKTIANRWTVKVSQGMSNWTWRNTGIFHLGAFSNSQYLYRLREQAWFLDKQEEKKAGHALFFMQSLSGKTQLILPEISVNCWISFNQMINFLKGRTVEFCGRGVRNHSYLKGSPSQERNKL